ncbi:MAG: molybdopterin cofactor-binding domain-containing protein, partial [Alphaproteobacteria bacterium]
GNETFTTSIDALAIQSGSDAWMPVDRLRVDYPPASFERIGVNYYAACGAVVALGVDKVSGDVAVEAVHQVLECGTSIVPELVSGISQGGIAMGIGHALHEYLPQLEGGPGDGTWNLNRYIVPKAGQVPVWKTTLEVLPPLSETDPPKGMAEVVMIPVVPAILNGINNAVGARIRSLPATPEKILEAL